MIVKIKIIQEHYSIALTNTQVIKTKRQIMFALRPGFTALMTGKTHTLLDRALAQDVPKTAFKLPHPSLPRH